MNKIFYAGIAALILFEIVKVYLIMPMPGSQEIESLDIAYFLHVNRWYFRFLFGTSILIGGFYALRREKKWIPLLACAVCGLIVYYFNFEMTAENIFRTPETLTFASRSETHLDDSTLVLVTEHGEEAKAYPIRYIGYHHQVRDTIGGKHVMITYCTVCRTGRVFEPRIDGKLERFRLVGMDHYNAMFEDRTTESWWRQASGEAVAGPQKGKKLDEVPSAQMTLGKFFTLYPFGRVMQAERIQMHNYDTLGRYEKGKSEGRLTRTDSLSWQEKSWVLGVEAGDQSKAYDWNDVTAKRLIQDTIGESNVVVILSEDGQSFAAFEYPEDSVEFTLRGDTLFSTTGQGYDFNGRVVYGDGVSLRKLNAYQEFWHSWHTFHPNTGRHD